MSTWVASPSDAGASASSGSTVGGDVFKRPLPVPPPRKRFKKTVLDEDNFIRELEGIVERDYFPDLRRLRVQNDYLSATGSGDSERVEALRSQYGTDRPGTAASWSSGPLDTPAGTPSHAGEDAAPSSIADGDTDDPAKPLSLNEYLATHTSEDDESFAHMMYEARRRHRVRHPWLYAQEGQHNAREAALLTTEVPSIEEQANPGRRPRQVANWHYRSENDLMYVPKGLALTAEEKIDEAKHKQEITVTNTRFKDQPFDGSSQRVAMTAAAQLRTGHGGKIGVDGREIVDTARAADRGVVRTPSPAPGVDASPLMTWGQIDGSPFRLDGGTPASSVPASPFRISAPQRREQLALALAERASSRHRDKKNRALAAARRQVTSPAISAALDRISTLSPAARRLARVGRSTDRALRASYTPSPAERRTAGTASPAPSTPADSPAAAAGITDGLLQLPATRQRAADFFK